MKRQTFRGLMKTNPEFVATSGDVDLYPRFLGVLKSGGRVHGVVCWWSRYTLVDGKRKPIHPRIGIELRDWRGWVDVTPDKTGRKLTGRFGMWGHEIVVSLSPKGKGDEATIAVTTEITGTAFHHEFSNADALPTEFFFRAAD